MFWNKKKKPSELKTPSVSPKASIEVLEKDNQAKTFECGEIYQTFI